MNIWEIILAAAIIFALAVGAGLLLSNYEERRP